MADNAIYIDCVWENQGRMKKIILSKEGVATQEKEVWGLDSNKTARGRPAFESRSRAGLGDIFYKHHGPPDLGHEDDIISLPTPKILENGDVSAWRWLSPWQLDNSESFDIDRRTASNKPVFSGGGDIAWLYADGWSSSKSNPFLAKTQKHFEIGFYLNPKATATTVRCRRWVRPREKILVKGNDPRAAQLIALSKRGKVNPIGKNGEGYKTGHIRVTGDGRVIPLSPDGKAKHLSPAKERVVSPNKESKGMITPKKASTPSKQLFRSPGESPLSPEDAKSALDIAKSRGHKTVAKLLKRYGNIEDDEEANDNDIDEDGNDIMDDSDAWSNVEV